MLGLIGVGRWGKNILSTLEKIPGADLKYLCSNNAELLAFHDSKYEKISVWQELLKKPDLTGIIIATPAKTHAEIATAFLEKNIPVFVEKPMTVNTAEAKKLRIVVKKTGTILMVGYQYVFNEYVRFVKKEIDSGSFGNIIDVASEQRLIPEMKDMGVLGDAGPHPLSIFQYFFNTEKILSVEGSLEAELAQIAVQFEKGPALNIITASSGERKVRKLTVTGSVAVAILDETLENNKLTITKNGKTSYPHIGAKTSLQNELEHFLHCIKTDETPLTNIDFGYKVTEWLEVISKKLA